MARRRMRETAWGGSRRFSTRARKEKEERDSCDEAHSKKADAAETPVRGYVPDQSALIGGEVGRPIAAETARRLEFGARFAI